MQHQLSLIPKKNSNLHIFGLIGLFFISGFSALCYQLVWQRILFATFGINIESVTIIVSLFMFGLGIGAILGTRLQKYPNQLLRLFIACEIGIALFGLISKSLIMWLGSLQALNSLWAIALCVYILLALPTLLMGATLPLMVGFINRYIGHTGKTIGWLYASNTFGAVAASILTVKLIFVFWGLQSTIYLAVSLNFLTAALSYLLYRKLRLSNAVQPDDQEIEACGESAMQTYSPVLLMGLGFMMGYISLSQELVWYRVLGFLTSNRPQIFGLLLGAFLTGIALASLVGGKICIRANGMQKYIFGSLIAMQFAWYVSFPLLSYVTINNGRDAGLQIGLWLAGLTAFLAGGVFPALCHAFQVRTRETAGSAVGKLYFANVMGATIGPLLTGFILFEYWSIQSVILFTGLVTAIVVVVMLGKSKSTFGVKIKNIGLCLVISICGVYLHQQKYPKFLEKLQFAKPSPAFDYYNTNRSGVISVVDGAVYGNGAYDGRINTDPRNDSNAIWRAYAVATMHPNPKRVLMIGLSSGSWANVMSYYQPLEELVVVEINKGYLDVVSHYETESRVLNNPKVNIIIDDGRRWVINHPNDTFDVIIMNTIYYWRSNATNLLSKEFLEICKKRLNPDGILYINNTGSEDVTYTASQVFPYVSQFWGNMLIASEAPSNVPNNIRNDNLLDFVFPNGDRPYKNNALRKDMVKMNYPDQTRIIQQRKDLLLITDDNMATEFRR